MRLNEIGEDALLAVSAMQRTILHSGVASCYAALNRKETNMDKYHAWTFNCHTVELQQTDLSEDNVIDMVELDPMDVDAAIEEAGWCGALGATYGFPFVIMPIGSTKMPDEAKAFIRANIK